jgi:hypothetical protein
MTPKVVPSGWRLSASTHRPQKMKIKEFGEVEGYQVRSPEGDNKEYILFVKEIGENLPFNEVASELLSFRVYGDAFLVCEENKEVVNLTRWDLKKFFFTFS